MKLQELVQGPFSKWQVKGGSVEPHHAPHYSPQYGDNGGGKMFNHFTSK